MALKVGLVGCGRWGMNHLKTLAELKKTGQISSIHTCDINATKSVDVKDFADTFHTNWQDMVLHNDLDIVAIVTPVGTHCDLAIALLDYCDTLFIEKPIGISAAEASSIIAKVQEVGGRLLVGHILRFHEAVKQANAAIAQGEIGELQRIEFNRLTTRPPPDNPNIFEAMAIHGIDTACYLFGELEPSRISVDGVLLNNQNYSTNAKILLEFPGMKEAIINVGWNGGFEDRAIQLYGSRGKIGIETGQVPKMIISVEHSAREAMLEQPQLPLAGEWRFMIDMLSTNSGDTIYPQPGSIIRSVKWVELAKQQIETRASEIDERIE
mgnify:CR=1 FL=1|tara:strand:+ start:2691 stop:3662 length:972 start_codon:yes stop_codon:yes gene_type:complete